MFKEIFESLEVNAKIDEKIASLDLMMDEAQMIIESIDECLNDGMNEAKSARCLQAKDSIKYHKQTLKNVKKNLKDCRVMKDPEKRRECLKDRADAEDGAKEGIKKNKETVRDACSSLAGRLAKKGLKGVGKGVLKGAGKALKGVGSLLKG